jgi:hypothetical protein
VLKIKLGGGGVQIWTVVLPHIYAKSVSRVFEIQFPNASFGATGISSMSLKGISCKLWVGARNIRVRTMRNAKRTNITSVQDWFNILEQKLCLNYYKAISLSFPVWWPGNKNSPTVTHACRKRRLKWVVTLSLGDINTEVWSSAMGVGRGANNPTL